MLAYFWPEKHKFKLKWPKIDMKFNLEKKGATKNLKKDLRSKWAAKVGVVLVLMRVKF